MARKRVISLADAAAAAPAGYMGESHDQFKARLLRQFQAKYRATRLALGATTSGGNSAFRRAAASKTSKKRNQSAAVKKAWVKRKQQGTRAAWKKLKTEFK